MRKFIRIGFLGSLTAITYGRSIVQMFFAHNIIQSLLGIILFFLVFHFFYIDIYPKNNEKTTLIVLLITLGEVIGFNYFVGPTMIWGLIIINISILYLGNTLRISANESTSFRASDYFRDGGYIFTMGITIAYGLFSMGLYSTFPFNCNDLSNQSGKIIEVISKPMNISKHQDVGEVLNKTKVSDILLVGKVLNIESETKEIEILKNFKQWKNDLITKTMDENKELNQGICEFSLNKLNDKLKNPEFQTSVIVLIIAVAYPFIRLITQVVSLIGFVIFMVMKKLKIYSVQKVVSEIEKIG